MRILSLLCVIVVMALNLVPCADLHEKLDESISFSFSNPDKHTERSVEDACTPFCNCSCCASSVVVKLTEVLIAPVSIQHNPSVPYFEGDYVVVSSSIWQPPKFV
ncbi:DUF6660 family protein [Pedobacter metabolipauper]|uniref:Uncharacterized protein n=1 Tax=Pedobacter metabolipauper TaxID=425513 RepID=A0A4R6SW40_9SPHI|nr:DUF6660 family protein [Pedobacter metabolipauper]TDQ08591.1 hypothetical protein ATK78_3107 [Pedobacter metabolipauper]